MVCAKPLVIARMGTTERSAYDEDLMFTKGIFTFIVAFGLLGQMAAAPAGDGTPRLERTGSLTRLMVDEQPFLMLAGELHNSSSSSLDYMKPIWPKLAAMNLNTVLAPVSWELLEPEEGKFEFAPDS